MLLRGGSRSRCRFLDGGRGRGRTEVTVMPSALRAASALADEGLVEADGLGDVSAAQPAVNTPTRRINTAMMGVVMCFIFIGIHICWGH